MRNPKEIKEEGKTLLFANYLPFVLVALILALEINRYMAVFVQKKSN